jgi:ketosteroid isomerase-like protein
MSTVDSVKVLLATFDAYAERDFNQLAELYSEDVTWGGTEPGPWDCMNRDDVFGMFRVRMRRNAELAFDQILSIGSRVLLAGHDGEGDRFTSVFTVEGGRIVRVQDYPSTHEALGSLKQPRD